MCNRLYEYLAKTYLLFDKQFGFRKHHSTEHALIKLVDGIYDFFYENKYTLGVFIDSKAFDTFNHNILLKKLKLYRIENSNLKWFTSYLSRRKQYIKHKDIKTGYLDLYNVSNILQPIMFADDTNLFSS